VKGRWKYKMVIKEFLNGIRKKTLADILINEGTRYSFNPKEFDKLFRVILEDEKKGAYLTLDEAGVSQEDVFDIYCEEIEKDLNKISKRRIAVKDVLEALAKIMGYYYNLANMNLKNDEQRANVIDFNERISNIDIDYSRQNVSQREIREGKDPHRAYRNSLLLNYALNQNWGENLDFANENEEMIKQEYPGLIRNIFEASLMPFQRPGMAIEWWQFEESVKLYERCFKVLSEVVQDKDFEKEYLPQVRKMKHKAYRETIPEYIEIMNFFAKGGRVYIDVGVKDGVVYHSRCERRGERKKPKEVLSEDQGFHADSSTGWEPLARDVISYVKGFYEIANIKDENKVISDLSKQFEVKNLLFS